MITVTDSRNKDFFIEFAWEDDPCIRSYKMGLEQIFRGKYLETLYVPLHEQSFVYIGCGRKKELDAAAVREIFATAAQHCRERKKSSCSMDLSMFVETLGSAIVVQAVLGLGLGGYRYTGLKTDTEPDCICAYQLGGIAGVDAVKEQIEEGEELCRDICFTRDLVNTPGNMLRPLDLERKITAYMSDVPVESCTLVYGQLRTMGFEALCGVGGSSEYPPCLLILRYRGNPSSDEIYGLVGKGVTCDTGGYCLKSVKSMAGIKGDMAGAAAVAGALHAIAGRKLKLNVTACLPMCENRIAGSALLPGDVITGYGGRTIEVLNTDAEGRLILSDAVSYAVRQERVSRLIDIATLTGAVWSALGYTVAGAMSDDDTFYDIFEKGLENSAEKYLRFPFGREHKEMIRSEVADVKNVGADCCGTITAGLFIREFCEGKPWIHLDIAGTAWCETPAYAYESKGATGAGLLSLYYAMKQAAVEVE